MTIHRLMSAIATEQVRLRDDRTSETTAPAGSTNDRDDAAAE